LKLGNLLVAFVFRVALAVVAEAGREYNGPCTDAYDFRTMSLQAKARWASLCSANFPCSTCEIDWHTVCPQLWEQVGDQMKCQPTGEYVGPCKAVSFEGFSKAMLENWSAQCAAYWKCKRA